MSEAWLYGAGRGKSSARRKELPGLATPPGPADNGILRSGKNANGSSGMPGDRGRRGRPGGGPQPGPPRPRGGGGRSRHPDRQRRSEEHTSELQSLMRISYAVFCLKKKKTTSTNTTTI